MTTPGLAKLGRPGGLFPPVHHLRRPAPAFPFVRIPKTSPPGGPLMDSLGILTDPANRLRLRVGTGTSTSRQPVNVNLRA